MGQKQCLTLFQEWANISWVSVEKAVNMWLKCFEPQETVKTKTPSQFKNFSYQRQTKNHQMHHIFREFEKKTGWKFSQNIFFVINNLK